MKKTEKKKVKKKVIEPTKEEIDDLIARIEKCLNEG